MGLIGFGTSSDATCLADLAVRGPGGEALCVGYRVAYHEVGLPAYVTDEGYVVIATRTRAFTSLDARAIGELQRQGTLPTPLPSYELAAGAYARGYALWPALIAAAAIALVWRRLRGRRAARVNSRSAAAPAG